MQMGFNTDVDHHGITVHIQTEDHGLGDNKITTQVFFSGRILDSRTISYAEAIANIAADEERDAEITKRMRAIHRHFLNRIREGTYDAKLPLDDAVKAAPPAAKKAAQAAPSLTEEISALPEEEVFTEELLQAGDEDIHERLRDPKDRAWRGFEDDFSTALGTALRNALGV